MSAESRRSWSVVSWVTLIGVGLLVSLQAWSGIGRMIAPPPFHYDALTVAPVRVHPGDRLAVFGTITKGRDCAGTATMRLVDSANVFHDLFTRSIGARPPSTYDFRNELTVPPEIALGPATFAAVTISNCGGDDYIERVLRDVSVVAP